jgi:hypothetical protein
MFTPSWPNNKLTPDLQKFADAIKAGQSLDFMMSEHRRKEANGDLARERQANEAAAAKVAAEEATKLETEQRKRALEREAAIADAHAKLAAFKEAQEAIAAAEQKAIAEK